MESFDIDVAKLAGFSQFDETTLTVMTKYGDVDDQLDNFEANFGIDQQTADLEKVDNTRVVISGYKEALTQTLRIRAEDADDTNCRAPSCRANFTSWTGNSTSNSEATIQQHTLQGEAIQNIDLVDKNYTPESNLLKTQGQMEKSCTESNASGTIGHPGQRTAFFGTRSRGGGGGRLANMKATVATSR
jgi:hypothetical protein